MTIQFVDISPLTELVTYSSSSSSLTLAAARRLRLREEREEEKEEMDEGSIKPSVPMVVHFVPKLLPTSFVLF